MKRLILSSLMIVALGAGSVFAAQNANTAKKGKPAAAKKATKNAIPMSGGSTAMSGGATSGGTTKNTTKKSSGKKHHRKGRRHAKKS